MAQVRVKQKYQITLPAEIMEQAHIQPDDVLEVEYANGVLKLVPLKTAQPDVIRAEQPIMAYAGSCKGSWGRTPEEIEANLAEDRVSWDR